MYKIYTDFENLVGGGGDGIRGAGEDVKKLELLGRLAGSVHTVHNS